MHRNEGAATLQLFTEQSELAKEVVYAPVLDTVA